MGAGKYNRRIKIQQWAETTDEFGGVIEGWEDYATVWARVEPVSGREYWQAAQVQAEGTIQVTVRTSAKMRAVDPTYRILHDGRVLEITHIIPDDLNRGEIVFHAKEAQ